MYLTKIQKVLFAAISDCTMKFWEKEIPKDNLDNIWQNCIDLS